MIETTLGGLTLASALAAVAVVALAGLIRGITGFGGAMVMAPPLALLLGPRLAVPITLMLEAFAAAPMLPAASRIAQWRVLAPIALAATASVPLGVHLLAVSDAVTLRRAIAAVVVVFALLMLLGLRYRGPHRLWTSIGLGGLSGAMTGATSISAPPVILYLLAGPDPVALSRATLTLYIVVISVVGLALLALRGLIDARALWLAAAMTPPYVIGLLVGTRQFSRFSDRRFRQFTIAFMLASAIVVLIA